jgi:hypothetical protein
MTRPIFGGRGVGAVVKLSPRRVGGFRIYRVDFNLKYVLAASLKLAT